MRQLHAQLTLIFVDMIQEHDKNLLVHEDDVTLEQLYINKKNITHKTKHKQKSFSEQGNTRSKKKRRRRGQWETYSILCIFIRFMFQKIEIKAISFVFVVIVE
jgi:hypothetical protein